MTPGVLTRAVKRGLHAAGFHRRALARTRFRFLLLEPELAHRLAFSWPR
jgi:hypothetical protein